MAVTERSFDLISFLCPSEPTSMNPTRSFSTRLDGRNTILTYFLDFSKALNQFCEVEADHWLALQARLSEVEAKMRDALRRREEAEMKARAMALSLAESMDGAAAEATIKQIEKDTKLSMDPISDDEDGKRKKGGGMFDKLKAYRMGKT